MSTIDNIFIQLLIFVVVPALSDRQFWRDFCGPKNAQKSQFPQWGPGRSCGKLGFLSIFGPQKSRQIMHFSIQCPSVVNEGANSADNKLNSMVSVLVYIENVVIMWWLSPSAHCYMAYLKPNQHDPFLNALGNKSSHFLTNLDQPVLAYKRCVGVEILCIIIQD